MSAAHPAISRWWKRGEPVIRAQGAIAGFPVRVPMVDVNAIGAGGGSIAWLDGAGGLRVGPHSAGSEPGPACYGRGGEEATVTDASVVLGWLDPAYFAGGSVALDPSLARAAIERRIAPTAWPIGGRRGAWHPSRRQRADGRGHPARIDPSWPAIRGISRWLRWVAPGRSMPPRWRRELGIGNVLIPRHPGVLSAAGLLAAPIEHEVTTAFPRPLAGLDFADVRRVLNELDGSCARLMAEESLGEHACVHTVLRRCLVHRPILPPGSAARRRCIRSARRAVSRLSGAARSYLRPCDRTARRDRQPACRCIAPAAATIWMKARIARSTPIRASRRVRSASPVARAPVQAPIYHRAAMPAGFTCTGPAIIEQDDTTTLIEPGWHGTVLDNGNLLLTRG